MDQNVTLGLTYYYRIAERNAAGAGPQSSSVSILLATVPGAPRDLQMIREDARANLSWLQPSMDGGLAVTGYSIYRSIGGGQETLFISINATSYVDSDLINGQQYSYRIKAINAIGEGAYSTGGSVVPGTIPSAPRNLTIEVRDNMVHIDWSSGLSDGGYSVREYVIYRGSSSSELTELSRISNATTYLDANVTEGNSYYYIVSASNELGESPTSSIATATVPSSNTLSLILIIAVVLSAMAIGYVVLKRRKR